MRSRFIFSILFFNFIIFNVYPQFGALSRFSSAAARSRFGSFLHQRALQQGIGTQRFMSTLRENPQYLRSLQRQFATQTLPIGGKQIPLTDRQIRIEQNRVVGNSSNFDTKVKRFMSFLKQKPSPQEAAEVYKKLMREIHPDRFATEEQNIRTKAGEASKTANRAYEDYKDTGKKSSFDKDTINRIFKGALASAGIVLALLVFKKGWDVLTKDQHQRLFEQHIKDIKNKKHSGSDLQKSLMYVKKYIEKNEPDDVSVVKKLYLRHEIHKNGGEALNLLRTLISKGYFSQEELDSIRKDISYIKRTYYWL